MSFEPFAISITFDVKIVSRSTEKTSKIYQDLGGCYKGKLVEKMGSDHGFPQFSSHYNRVLPGSGVKFLGAYRICPLLADFRAVRSATGSNQSMIPSIVDRVLIADNVL